MEYEQIKKLLDDMGDSKLTDVSIEFPDGIKISMKKEVNNVIVKEQVIQNDIKEKTNDVIRENEENDKNLTGNIVKSPMVGTFYSAPSPTSPKFVEVGKKVKKGDVLCIIEAMKLMNEIESEFDGEIVEIYLKDEDAVEYGKPLFKIV